MTAAATRVESRPLRSCLLVVTGARVEPELLETAIARAHTEHDRLHVVIPAVLPPTLPISAMPAHLAQRPDALEHGAVEALCRLGARGRVEIVTGRDVRSIMLAAAGRVDRVVLAGSAGWSLRRAARGIAPVTVIRDRTSPRRPHPPRIPVTGR